MAVFTVLLEVLGVLAVSQTTIDPDDGTEVPLHDNDMHDYKYDEQPFVSDAKRTAASLSYNDDGFGWTKAGAGYCFPTTAHEEKYRIGSWRRGMLHDAKKTCERVEECVGLHLHTVGKESKFVLLFKVGAPGGQDVGERACYKYERPPNEIELDCQPRGMVQCLDNDSTSSAEEALKKDWFIKFHSPECKHCIEFFPSFKKMATSNEFKGKFGFGGLDCMNYRHQGVCDKLGVKSLPTFILFRQGKYYLYEGPRERGDIEDWLEEWWDGEMDSLIKGKDVPKAEARPKKPRKKKKEAAKVKKVKKDKTRKKKKKLPSRQQDEL